MFNYPKTKQDTRQETLFGRSICDPYRWMEDVTDPDLTPWIDAQIALTRDYLDNQEARPAIESRLRTLYNYPKYGSVKVIGSKIIYTHNTGLQPQFVYWIQDGPTGTPEVLLDPNALSTDGTVAVTLSTSSKDDRYLAVLQADSGSDWQELKIIDLESKTLLSDIITGVKFTYVAWFRDGFFYSRYQVPEKGHELSAKNEDMEIYFHRLGTPQSDDILIFADREYPLRYNTLYTTKDDRYLILSISEGTSGNEIRVKSISSEDSPTSGEFITLFKGFDNEPEYIGSDGDILFFVTDLEAMNRKIISVNMLTGQIIDVIPEAKDNLEMAWKYGKQLVVLYLKDVVSHVLVFTLHGELCGNVASPGIGSVYEVTGSDALDDFYLTYGTFVSPLSLLQVNRTTLIAETFKASLLPYDASNYTTKQIFCTSKDGTQIPVFLTFKKGIELNGQNPTLLYAYGGFNVSLPPVFNPSNIFLIEQGGIYAQANLRGGSEYGERWHKDGMLFKKQNVFDDFIAVAESLIAQGYTSKEHLAIQGGSNGGLLMGAVVNQRPDLFKVVFPQVGVMDMLRYHRFTIGWGWMVEYGNPDEEVHFNNILAYSPLHNIEEKDYPAIMVMTADHDDRVVPAHSFKYIATLQQKNTSSQPMLIRIDKNAGHSAGKSVEKVILEQTDKYTMWGAFKNL